MTRRNALKNITIQKKTHAGLWLDKYLKDDADGSKQALIEDACKAGIPDGYIAAYNSRFGDGENTLFAKAEVDNCRLIIGLGQKGVLEAGITLDHTWGVPYIPGSALKGIASWAALQSDNDEWKKVIKKDGNKRRVGDCYLALFGGPDEKDKDEKGCVIFHDAWWIPEGNKLPIHLDVMTVHHQKYYQGEKNKQGMDIPPSDMDSPVPVPFVSVTGKFMIMLEGPEEWREVAIALLKYGLENHGIGAKTAGGYGRMKVDYKTAPQRQQEADKLLETQKAEKLQFCQNVQPGSARQELPSVYKWLKENNLLETEFGLQCQKAAYDKLKKTIKKWVEEQPKKEARLDWQNWLAVLLPPPVQNPPTANGEQKKKPKRK